MNIRFSETAAELDFQDMFDVMHGEIYHFNRCVDNSQLIGYAGKGIVKEFVI